MSNQDNAHIEANLEVIREYLIGQFKGFEVYQHDKPSALAYIHRDEIFRRTISSQDVMAAFF